MGRKLVNGYEAKRTRLVLDGQVFCIEDADIAEGGLAEEDVTCSEDAGPTQEVVDLQLSGTIQYTWDAADNPYNDPINLRVNSKHDALWYVHSDTDELNGVFWDFKLQVINHSHTNPVRGKIQGTLEFKSSGDIRSSYPSQSAVLSSG